MKYGPFLLIITIIMGIYVLPSVFARFAGTHTMEINQTEGIASFECQKCHQILHDELTATDAAGNTTQAHLNAAGNSSYTTGWLSMTIDNTTDYGICHFCHRPQAEMASSHTQTIVRACTDTDCHGNNDTTNNTAYPTAGQVGNILGATWGGGQEVTSGNVHAPWFNGMSNYVHRYQNETGTNYTLDYYACLACHTDVTVIRNTTKKPFAHDDPAAFKDRYI